MMSGQTFRLKGSVHWCLLGANFRTTDFYKYFGFNVQDRITKLMQNLQMEETEKDNNRCKEDMDRLVEEPDTWQINNA